MNPIAEDSAYGLANPYNSKTKGGRPSQSVAPVRVSFQRGPSK